MTAIFTPFAWVVFADHFVQEPTVVWASYEESNYFVFLFVDDNYLLGRLLW